MFIHRTCITRNKQFSYNILVYHIAALTPVTSQFISRQIGLIQKSFRFDIEFSANISKTMSAIAVKFSGWSFYTQIFIIIIYRYPLKFNVGLYVNTFVRSSWELKCSIREITMISFCYKKGVIFNKRTSGENLYKVYSICTSLAIHFVYDFKKLIFFGLLLLRWAMWPEGLFVGFLRTRQLDFITKFVLLWCFFLVGVGVSDISF